MTDFAAPEPMPIDVALAIAIMPRTRWVTRETLPRLPVREPDPPPTSCDGPHATECDPVIVYHARPMPHPTGMSHRVPAPSEAPTPDPWSVIIDRCRAACEEMRDRPGKPERGYGAASVSGDRRARLDRAAAIIRGAGELGALLHGEPEHVVARARAAIARVV